ncbi:MAG: glutathione S-transferase N-terminal domain-containing protein [Candidatus Protistobacter heckmanni]|nr:glutathione S-transferase N-terminal domain-containing protein [Candidatus Protistobacter heckmanni]
MSQLKIWGLANSINVQKILWCCEELNMPYERIDAGMNFGVNKTPEYKAMNPNGLVPTIEDDGFVLGESHSILCYLARKHSGAKLLPADPQGSARIEQRMDWAYTSAWIPTRVIFWTLVRTPPEQRNMAEVETNRQMLLGYLETAEKHLEKHAYFAGDAFSLADIPCGRDRLPLVQPGHRAA